MRNSCAVVGFSFRRASTRSRTATAASGSSLESAKVTAKCRARAKVSFGAGPCSGAPPFGCPIRMLLPAGSVMRNCLTP